MPFPVGSDQQLEAAFVGRERELGILWAKLADAFASRGSLLMLAGEAGVGKTRVLREFAGHARQRGAVVLWGSCFEDEWRPPYGPWAQALGQYAAAIDPGQLRRQLGTGAAPLAQLVPEIRAALPETPLPSPLGPNEERVRLFDAFAQLLLCAAADSPILLILDDLHWADGDSLRLLRHLARFVGRARVLIVGAYRDPEPGLDGQHPLVNTLVILRRESGCQQLRIQGLDRGAVIEYLSRAAGETFPLALVEAVYAETGGNPFYLGEVFQHLVEEGKIQRRVGRWSTDLSMGELGIPEGVRQVVLRRLSRLSPDTNAVLRMASGFSAGFEFGWLRALIELPEDLLLNCVDEALQAGLIRVADQTARVARYDFSHAIVRHTLYAEQNPDRRARLHRQIAESLERVFAGRGREHAAELATHYFASASLPGATRGAAYALAAAEQARARAALDRAVTFLRMARDLVAEDEPATRADVCCRLAVAEAEALLLEDALSTTEQALVAQGEAHAEPPVQVEFLASVARSLKEGGANPTVWEPLVERGLALVGGELDLTWARLTLLRDRWEIMSTGLVNASRWLGFDPVAVSVARAIGDEEDYARTLDPLVWRGRAETDAVLSLARSWRRPTAILRALDVVSRDLLYRHGAYREAAACYRELLALSERYGSIPGQGEAFGQLAGIEAVLGRPERVDELKHRARDMASRLGSTHRLRFIDTGWGILQAYYLDGDWATLAAMAASFTGSPEAARSPLGLVAGAFAALANARAGQSADARRYLAAVTPITARLEATAYLQSSVVAIAAAAVWELGAVEHAAIYRRLAADLERDGVGGPPLGPHDLTIARMDVLLGGKARAQESFARARSKVDEGGHPPLRAIVDYDEALALLLEGSDDRDRVAALIDGARRAFRELGLDGWDRRAVALAARASRELAGSRRENPSSESSSPFDGLTAREVEVLRLIAGGLTNKEIAAELVVSVATVERHVTNLYGKIGARGRADATVYYLSCRRAG